MSTTTTNFGLTKPDATDNVDVSVINTNYDLIDTKAALKANSSGGGELGTSASAATGAAVGKNAVSTGNGAALGSGANATGGGAVGSAAKETNNGGAVGANATTSYGGAVGYRATSQTGAAVGNSTSATAGAAVGGGAKETAYGAAVGYNTVTSAGAAVGKEAKCLSGQTPIDAIQLGTGTNSTVKSMQVYGTQLLYYHSTDNTHYIPLSLITASYSKADPLDQAAFKAALGIS